MKNKVIAILGKGYYKNKCNFAIPIMILQAVKGRKKRGEGEHRNQDKSLKTFKTHLNMRRKVLKQGAM